MEADWAAEIGPRLDHIDTEWPGFIDLRENPEGVRKVPEAARGSALHEALTALNGPSSPLFTTKCDVWPVRAEELDPFELESSHEHARAGIGSYIDLVARNAELFASFPEHEAWTKAAALRLREMPLAHGRADLVIRAALSRDSGGFGVTLYATGCGPDTLAAEAAWAAVLRAAVAVTMEEAQRSRASSSIG